MQRITDARQAGFTLIEALIAMLVLAFGLLAVAGLQTTLAHNSDVAKQRTEATRLAQAKIEELRGYQQLPAASGIPAYADIVGSNDTPATTTNTSFTRAWTVTEDAALTQKILRINVDWVDRQGQPQSVLLSSVISRSDPADVGTLGMRPTGPQNKKPYYGMPPIPTVGKYIGGGKSAIQLPAGGAYIVFSSSVDATVSRCMGTVTSSTDASTVCANPLSAFLITGFISGLPSPSFDTDAQATAVTLRLVDGAGNPITPAAECFVSRVPTGGTFPRDPGSPAPTTFVSSFYQYVCLIQPVAAGPNAGTWSGRLEVIEADAAISLMQGSDRICRLSWDQDASGAPGDSNREHPDVYTNVTGTLLNQNFKYIPRIDATTPAPCAGFSPVNGIAVTYSPVNLIP
jgi:type IV pilus modification protein PilV